ncbi:hypothetical protein [Nocardioides sp.]|uniref:hypothetical protein n=1 Tax=Nocardioides sp. TaxID=35761 RepID=UPI001A2D77FD|nr:hypothetical protein [Nocardioides sp.]MBJ7355783.1 hypothetical protein [Nocardioides sp.]
MHIDISKPALVVAAACLVLGTTSGAVAGALVTGEDIKDGTVTTKDVKDKSLKTSDLSTKTVESLTGPAGAPGAAGPPGAPGLNGYQHVTGSPAVLSSGGSATLTVDCPAGTTALGGSFTSDPAGTANLVAGGPADFDAWQVRVANPTDFQVTVTPHAVCTRP